MPFTISTKISGGHGKSDFEAVCWIDDYKINYHGFPPLFEKIRQAQDFMDSLEMNHRYLIIQLEFNAQA